MKRKRLYFDDLLKEKLKDPEFKKAYDEEDLPAQLAVRIAQLRQEKSLSQKALARKLGTTQQVISSIETHRQNNLTLGTLRKIARALGAELVVELRENSQ